jgi:glyoxylase I family protein
MPCPSSIPPKIWSKTWQICHRQRPFSSCTTTPTAPKTLKNIIQSDIVPSTGEYCPYTHFFFRLKDGSCIAFFDLGDDQAALPSPNTPLWVNHISFRVNTLQELEAMKTRLQAEGIEVLGITDHNIFKSIYFFDPNGVRLELTAQLADDAHMQKESSTVHATLAAWTARKQQWRAERAVAAST